MNEADNLALANNENYLGDVEVVDAILRMFIWSCVDRRFGDESSENNTQADVQDALRIAAIFLGQDTNYVPMPGWNRPGYLDKFLADNLNVSGSPDEIVASALIQCLVDIYQLINYASEDTTRAEQWTWQVGAIIDRYDWMLLGVRESDDSVDDSVLQM